MKTGKLLAAIALVASALAFPALAQVQTEVPPVVPSAKPMAVEDIKVHGTALEGNLEGDAVDRDVFVFLPPSYTQEKSRRYPVVYALHGFSIGAEQWTHEIHVPQTIEGAFAQGAKEMIVVLPDSKTLHYGSPSCAMFSTSMGSRTPSNSTRVVIPVPSPVSEPRDAFLQPESLLSSGLSHPSSFRLAELQHRGAEGLGG